MLLVSMHLIFLQLCHKEVLEHCFRPQNRYFFKVKAAHLKISSFSFVGMWWEIGGKQYVFPSKLLCKKNPSLAINIYFFSVYC